MIGFVVRLSLLTLALIQFTGCKGSSSDSAPTTPVTYSVKSNQSLNISGREVDLYVPSNATSAIVFLHGGGGNKEGFAYNLGLKTTSNSFSYTLTSAGQAWLAKEKVIAVFPQGLTVGGANWTWSNRVMTSGADDVLFLQNLVAAIKADTSLPAVSKVYIVGHSNGGMMANRMWCESPNTFDGYVTFAGPPSTKLASTGANPCNPTATKPYMGVVGDRDRVLQSGGNMNATNWTIASSLVSNANAWEDATPQVLNDKVYHTTRVGIKCSGSVGTPTTSGQVTTYSDCNDSVKLVVIAQVTVNSTMSGGDHCIATLSGPCVTTLTGNTGIDLKQLAVDFLKNF
ncbi:alpha/beta hydrolase family esterase [Bdellovibrio sp. HCB209]|uniref:alpha/beta hydrolase family esterase n=1 Tax=Bdellovibrio sp. HCB209 TaxID=3394354 RepID=UPI0039B56805